jgi:ubiquinone biosynthesis protein
VPIASGSVSQVYKAKYKGKKVAIKVRHPNVDKYIERDINLLFFLSYLASFISPAMEIPVSETSMKKTLTDQIDFTFEMKNLNKFNEMFKDNSEVYFPLPFEDTTVESVLVETFIGGNPVTYY